MFDSPIIGVAIGLVLFFGVLSTMASAITEIVSRWLGLRGAYLLTGLRTLVDGTEAPPEGAARKPAAKTPFPAWNAADAPKSTHQPVDGGTSAPADRQPASLAALLDTPALGGQGTLRRLHSPAPGTTSGSGAGKKRLTLREKRSLPSYLSSRTIAAGILDMLVPDASGETTMRQITDQIANLEEGPLKQHLLNVAKASMGSVDNFRNGIEAWYDDHMDRVSGWYKRYTRWITVAVGAVIVVGLNIQIFGFAQNLYTDQAFGQSVVTKAVASSQCQDSDKCLENARQTLQELAPGLQIGWGEPASCTVPGAGCTSFLERHGYSGPVIYSGSNDEFWRWFTLVLEWLITVLAVIPGSRFWFDLVNQFSSLRSSGPKPPRSTGKA